MEAIEDNIYYIQSELPKLNLTDLTYLKKRIKYLHDEISKLEQNKLAISSSQTPTVPRTPSRIPLTRTIPSETILERESITISPRSSVSQITDRRNGGFTAQASRPVSGTIPARQGGRDLAIPIPTLETVSSVEPFQMQPILSETVTSRSQIEEQLLPGSNLQTPHPGVVSETITSDTKFEDLVLTPSRGSTPDPRFLVSTPDPRFVKMLDNKDLLIKNVKWWYLTKDFRRPEDLTTVTFDDGTQEQYYIVNFDFFNSLYQLQLRFDPNEYNLVHSYFTVYNMGGPGRNVTIDIKDRHLISLLQADFYALREAIYSNKTTPLYQLLRNRSEWVRKDQIGTFSLL